MDEMNLEYNFGQGFVQNERICRVVAQYDKLVEYGSECSLLMMWNVKTGQWHHFNLGWIALKVICTDTQMFALGPKGNTLKADANGVREGYVDKSDKGPEARGELTDLCMLGDKLYAVGRAGQAYRMEGPKQWISWDKGLGKDVHLNGIHGNGADGLLAVGEEGEIWKCDGDTWTKEQSPTKATLNCVFETPSGVVYATGDGGTLLRSEAGKWVKIEQTATTDNLFGLQWFADKLYVASETGLYVLQDDRDLALVPVGYGPNWSFKHLHANEGQLWSFGKKHIFCTEDAETWENVTPKYTTYDPSEHNGPAATHSSCGCTGGGQSCD